MIPNSSAPTARTWLYDQLTVQLTPDPLNAQASLLVCYDTPGPDQPDDIVAVGAINRQIATNSLVGSGGAGWLEERYSIVVTVDVFRGGDNDQTAYLRCALLVDAICAAVRSDPSMGGAVLTARPSADTTTVEWDDTHMGRHATSELQIECYQRI